MRNTFLSFVIALCMIQPITATTPENKAPEWTNSVIWYQIMVERFRNGDPNNDPVVKNMIDEKMNIIPPAGWKVTPWTQSWYKPDEWMKNSGKSLNDLFHYRRYGGDLQGVMDKIDYLVELGITAVYFNPLNDAPSLHKYDARNYHHIDVHFGPDPEGDLALIAQEDLNDPSTWKWTSADKLFLDLLDKLHQKGIRVILDYSWNHTGTQFIAWNDVLKNQENSPYKDWFNIKNFDNPETHDNEFAYDGWMGNAYMPEVKKVDITTYRQPGHPYEGNIAPQVKQYIYNVTKRWLSPDNQINKGIDGFRLDVADHVGLGFWRDWRKYVKSIQPEAYLVGEIWWQKWPDQFMDPAPYTQGDIFDAVMYYHAYRPARYFFAKTDFPISAEQFKDSLTYHWSRLQKDKLYAMMNVSSSHDAPRLLTDFYNPGKYKFQANTNENPAYKTGKPDAETYIRLKLYLMHLFTTVGAPQIWNGEEMGMWGADDPHCRKPLMWKEMKFEPEVKHALQTDNKLLDEVKFNDDMFRYYQKLIQIRKSHPVLSHGEFEFLKSNDNVLIYKRFDADDRNTIIVVFNMSDQNYLCKLPVPQMDLLTGKSYKGQVFLKPLTGRIFIQK